MATGLYRLFIYSAGGLFFVAAVAKLISSFGYAPILQSSDPISSIQFRYLFWLVGSIELVIAGVCLFAKPVKLRAGLVAWLATNLLAYRLGLLWVGYQKPCPCLGNLTDALHIQPQTANTAMTISLAYLLTGSYATLFWLWRQNRQASRIAPSSETTTGSAS